MNKLRRLIAIHGLYGTIRLLTVKAIGLILWMTPSRRRARAEARDRDLEFDRRWGVDTSGMVIPGESEVVGSSWVFGSRYQGVDSRSLEQVLNELTIDHRKYTFIDFGSGKGRAVMMASQYPFARVIGVEYSEQLNAIAKQNVSRFPDTEKKCGGIELECADAASFPIPNGPLVIFLYNPFEKTIMSKLVQNVTESFRREPRRIVVLYFYAVAADVWREAGFIGEVRSSKQITIFDTEHRAIESIAA